MLLYKDMARRPRWRAAANRLHDLLLARQWIHYRPAAAVESQLQQAGLTLTHREDVTMAWYAHELRVFHRPAHPGGQA